MGSPSLSISATQPHFCWHVPFTYCLQMRFYFHMSGDGIGTLSVFRKSQGHLHLLLNLTGDQGNYWQMGEVPLSDIWDFQVIFEGKVGRNPKGDICLDDITFSPGCLLASSAGGSENTPPPSAGMIQSVLTVGMIPLPSTESHLFPDLRAICSETAVFRK